MAYWPLTVPSGQPEWPPEMRGLRTTRQQHESKLEACTSEHEDNGDGQAVEEGKGKKWTSIFTMVRIMPLLGLGGKSHRGVTLSNNTSCLRESYQIMYALIIARYAAIFNKNKKNCYTCKSVLSWTMSLMFKSPNTVAEWSIYHVICNNRLPQRSAGFHMSLHHREQPERARDQSSPLLLMNPGGSSLLLMIWCSGSKLFSPPISCLVNWSLRWCPYCYLYAHHCSAHLPASHK